MDIGKTLGGILGAIAPTIGTAFGGPLGGMAARAITEALGIDAASSEEQISAAVSNATPEQLLALKKADNDFKAQMKSLDIDLIKIMAADTANARQMQMTTRDLTPRILAAAVVGGLFGLLTIMAFHDLPAANKDALMLLLGALNSAFGAVMGFYFGSSASSQKKDDTIKSLTQ
jgi:hypothetical protein